MPPWPNLCHVWPVNSPWLWFFLVVVLTARWLLCDSLLHDVVGICLLPLQHCSLHVICFNKPARLHVTLEVRTGWALTSDLLHFKTTLLFVQPIRALFVYSLYFYTKQDNLVVNGHAQSTAVYNYLLLERCMSSEYLGIRKHDLYSVFTAISVYWLALPHPELFMYFSGWLFFNWRTSRLENYFSHQFVAVSAISFVRISFHLLFLLIKANSYFCLSSCVHSPPGLKPKFPMAYWLCIVSQSLLNIIIYQ